MATTKSSATTKVKKSDPPPAPAAEAIVKEQASPTTIVVDEDYGEFSGVGVETLGADDLLISRYRCVQALTKAKKRNRDLREGEMFYNTATKQGYRSAVVVVLHETHHIVERANDSQGKFIGTLSLTPADPRVAKARKANGGSLVKLLSVDRDPPTKLMETRDVHVVFLERDGVPCCELGVIQFDSTNLMPGKQWKNDRVAACKPRRRADGTMTKALPSFVFRSEVSAGIKDNSANNQADSTLFVVKPYGGPSWNDGVLKMSDPQHAKILRDCADHVALILSGQLKVDRREEEGQSEDEAEDASFDPDDDGRPSVDTSGVEAEEF